MGNEDRELIEGLQQGSLESLGILYDRYQRLVFRTALAITGDPEAAADLQQEVFLRLFRFAERIDLNRPLEPWLYRMTANLSYTWVKRSQRWIRPLEDLAEWLAGSRRNGWNRSARPVASHRPTRRAEGIDNGFRPLRWHSENGVRP